MLIVNFFMIPTTKWFPYQLVKFEPIVAPESLLDMTGKCELTVYSEILHMLHNSTVDHNRAKFCEIFILKNFIFSPTRVEQRKSTSPKNGEMRNRLPVRIKNEPGTEEVAIDSSDERPFCKLCGITPDDMEQHMLLRHRDLGQRFFCNVCDKNYTVSPDSFLPDPVRDSTIDRTGLGKPRYKFALLGHKPDKALKVL